MSRDPLSSPLPTPLGYRKGQFQKGNVPPSALVPVPVRFFAKVRKEEGGCWVWIGARDREGYGRFVEPPRTQWLAHRFSYTMHVGPIPAGLTIDHLCRNTSCVNPAHLEAVTAVVNLNRGRTRKVSDELATKILAVKPRGPLRARAGTGGAAVAAHFGTSTTTVYRIWKGEVSYARRTA